MFLIACAALFIYSLRMVWISARPSLTMYVMLTRYSRPDVCIFPTTKPPSFLSAWCTTVKPDGVLPWKNRLRMAPASAGLPFCAAPGTAMSEEAYQIDLREGRETFRRKYFGVDAWTDTRLDDELCRKCMDPSTPREDNRILGIDVRCGANLLHFKNCLRAYDLGRATLSAFVQDAKYWVDLKTICSGEVFCQPLRDLEAALEGRTYDYIILGMPLADYEDPKALLEIMRDHLSIGGRMAGRMEEDGEVFSLERYE